MLAPSSRALYSDALLPPLGYRFDRALATTFSLDLTVLLGIPLHLTLFAGERPPRELLVDGVALLEALRRTVGRTLVFCQQGRIHSPDMPRTLFTLLEPSIIEVRSPNDGGVFHPKLWLLRFVTEQSEPAYRLIVLSRNLTGDNSWDLSFATDGRPRRTKTNKNRPLIRLIRELPRLASPAARAGCEESVNTWTDDLQRVDWDLPPGFAEMVFHTVGLGGQAWVPPTSNQLAVISPFLGEEALTTLANTTQHARTLVSSTEALSTISPETLGQYDSVKVIDSVAAAEDEVNEYDESLGQPVGLHAKAYICSKGWDTHLFLGSANATTAGLKGRQNVELLVELVGRRSKVGSIDDFLGPDGLGEVLTDYSPTEFDEVDPETEQAGRDLDRAIGELLRCGLGLECSPRDSETWNVTLHTGIPPVLAGVKRLRVWPVTLPSGSASVDALPLAQGEPIDLLPSSLESITSLLAFEVGAEAAEVIRRFVVKVQLGGVDQETRSAAVLRSVIRDEDGFLRYLLLLLSDLSDELQGDGEGGAWTYFGRGDGLGLEGGRPVLEDLVRALCRDPDRVRSVGQLITELQDSGAREVVPERFLEMWKVFEEAVGIRS